MRRVPLVIVWSHKGISGPYTLAWGEHLGDIANALARYLVDVKGDARVVSFDNAHQRSQGPST